MNFWAFQRSMIDELQREFADFRRGHDSSHELLLPVTVDRLVTEGRIQVRVLSAPGPLARTDPRQRPPRRPSGARRMAAGGRLSDAGLGGIPNH